MSHVETATGGETNGVYGSELSWFYPKNGGNQEETMNTKQDPNSLPAADLWSLEVLCWGSVTSWCSVTFQFCPGIPKHLATEPG